MPPSPWRPLRTKPPMPSDEPIIIEPVPAPLSGAGQRGERGARGRKDGARRPRPTPRTWWFSAVLVALGAVLAFVIWSLPSRLENPLPALSSEEHEAVSPASRSLRNAAAEDEVIPPFRAQQLALAREQAQDKLADFVDLQLKLEEELNVAVWGAAEIANAKDRANAADALFIAADYEPAMAEYAAAVDDLHALVVKGDVLFDAEIAAGDTALAQRLVDEAVAAFDRAVAMRPGDARATTGAARASKLPQIITLLREAERAMLRDDHDAAYSLLAQVRDLDSATTGLHALLAQVATARVEKRRAAQLSDAFAALQAGRHDAALRAFDGVLRDHPQNVSALAGRQQALQARTSATINDLHALALAQAQAEDWQAALESYDRALSVDPSLQFARDGKAHVRERVVLIEAMDRVLADPALLSTDREFTAAKDVLARADAQDDAGGKFATRVGEFRDIVALGEKPVPLVLVSDNLTDVVIHKVGAIGAFERTELSLRPGRYVIVGSRDGCRDVRKEIVLSSGMPPVDIRCAERI